MDNRIYLNELYNLYKDLLNEKEQNCFALHYLEDYSMKEISELENITRSRVGKIVKDTELKLLKYESIIKKQKLVNCLHNLTSLEDLAKIKAEINKIVDNSTK